ncbi:hypothetical protein FHR32_004282 [Streptosporangium album]|uniref:Uncharacterized protein n=1 Tax=Streptosporangium album TaxID=47479 RepID=A0A7W7RXR0_9ACTN|nr:hypothetical protein [Streptosporangium album]MBB4939977.1 hypothetical protein [Streptosporangium album]
MNPSLVCFEAWRLLRSPILWGAALAALVMESVQGAAWLPDLTMVTIDAVTASTLVGAAVMITANLAAGRDRRHALPETLAALPGRAALRTRAVALAALAVRRHSGRQAALAGAALQLALYAGTQVFGDAAWPEPGSPQWDAIHAWWLVALPLSLLVLVGAHRDVR